MLVSVCLPTFNGSKFLKSAIESVLNQSYSDVELLIADDCSDDSSFDIARRYADVHPNVVCWKNERRLGLFENYNSCLSRAGGSLIKPFAQDDLLKENALAEMVEVFKKEEGVALVFCDREAGGVYSANPEDDLMEQLPAGRTAGKDAILSSLRNYRNMVGEPVTVMCTNALKQVRFDSSYHSLGDFDCWLRILAHGDVYRIANPLVSFHQHDASATMTMLKNMDWVLDFYRLSKQYESYLNEIGVTRDEFCLHFTETAGTLIDKMVRSGKLQIDELDGFREVAYYSMRRCAELAFKSREYDAVVGSTSWRITGPLRSLMKLIGR